MPHRGPWNADPAAGNSAVFAAVRVATVGLILLLAGGTPGIAQENPSALNEERQEDFKDLVRLSVLAQLIKPDCRSLFDEELPLPEIPVSLDFPAGLKALWLEAARQSESDLQLQAAEAIAKAHTLGLKDLEDTVPVLAELLNSPDSRPVVRLAAARSLIALGAREHAPLLRTFSASGLEAALRIEPALADWNDPAMREVWLARLESGAPFSGLVTLAVQAAARTGLKEATPHLRRLVRDRRSAANLRLEAAKALAELGDPSIVAEARQLAAGQTPAASQTGAAGQAAALNTSGHGVLERLLAARLLVRQSGPDAVSLLTELAVDTEPATATLAFRRLLEMDPRLTRTALDHAVGNADPGLRQLAAEALFRLQTPADVTRLSRILNDPNPLVRSAARRWLIQSDDVADLKDAVRTSVMEVLVAEAPRGLAQAAIAVGSLDHEPAADRLVDLLGHEAGDVSIGAAWALRKLAVPATAERIFQHLRQDTDQSLIEVPMDSNTDLSWVWDMYEQHKHLVEVLGILNYREADEYFRQYVAFPPTPPVGHPFFWIHCTHRRELRTRVLWALGVFHAGQPPEDLAGLLVARLDDQKEVPHVAAAAALALGRMKAVAAEPALRKFYTSSVRYTEDAPPDSIRAFACRIALEHLSGESLPPLTVEPWTMFRTGWFLEPLEFEKQF